MAHTLSCSLTGKSTFFCKPAAPVNAVPVCFFTTSAPCSHSGTFHVSKDALFCTVAVTCFAPLRCTTLANLLTNCQLTHPSGSQPICSMQCRLSKTLMPSLAGQMEMQCQSSMRTITRYTLHAPC